MVPETSPIAGPHPGSSGPPTATVSGAGGAGSRPAHCGTRFSKPAWTSAEPVSVHAPVPRQAPHQPANAASAAGEAVSAIEVPTLAVIAHVPGQSIPGGFERTRPVPLPVGVTVIRKLPYAGTANIAATWWSAFICSEQGPVPEQSPCHSRKVDPGSAVAVSSTVLPPGTSTRHSVRQELVGLAACTAPPAETRIRSECDPAPDHPVPAACCCASPPAEIASRTSQPIERILRSPPDERSLAQAGCARSRRQRTSARALARPAAAQRRSCASSQRLRSSPQAYPQSLPS